MGNKKKLELNDEQLRKASSSEKRHVCHPQGDAVFENTCEWCEHRYTCDKAHTYIGLGSPGA